MRRLIVETNPSVLTHRDPHPAISITPNIAPDFWHWRVRLTEKQALLAFPKFGSIGCGFAVEEDWNSNLPVDCSTEEIYKHIRHNKGDKRISKADCYRAIDMLRNAALAAGEITEDSIKYMHLPREERRHAQH